MIARGQRWGYGLSTKGHENLGRCYISWLWWCLWKLIEPWTKKDKFIYLNYISKILNKLEFNKIPLDSSCSDITVNSRGPFLRQPTWLSKALLNCSYRLADQAVNHFHLASMLGHKHQWRWQQLPTWDTEFLPPSPWSPHAPGPSWILLVPASGLLPSFSTLVTQLRCCPDSWAVSSLRLLLVSVY